MSLTEFQLTDVHVKIQSSNSASLVAGPLPEVRIAVNRIFPDVKIIAAGNMGPPGPPGQWVSLSQAEYDALVLPDPDTLYVIIP